MLGINKRQIYEIDSRHQVITILAFVTGLLQLATVLRIYSSPDTYLLPTDTAMFEHAGWLWTNGATPYVDFWIVKPPLSIETTALLSMLSGGEIQVLHTFSVILTNLALAGSIILLGLVTYRVTNQVPSSVIAGIFFLAYPGMHYFAAYGIRAKYFTVFFGLLAIYFRQRDRTVYSGMAAAASAGFWQLGVIFVIVIIFYRMNIRDLLRILIGMIVVTILSLTPIIIQDGFVPMIAQVVVANVLTPDSTNIVGILKRFGKGGLILGYATIPFLLGVLGTGYTITDTPSKNQWLALGTILAGVQVIFIDFDSGPDLFLLLTFSALGMGLLIKNLSSNYRELVIILVSISVLASGIGFGGFGILFDDISTLRSDSEPQGLATRVAFDIASNSGIETNSDSLNGRQYILYTSSGNITFQSLQKKVNYAYWNKIRPINCNYREHPKRIVEAFRRLDYWVSDKTRATCPELRR